MNEEVLSFLRHHGGVHTRTVAYTPQHKWEMARASMIHACAHVSLLGEAVRTAAYLINRVTTNHHAWLQHAAAGLQQSHSQRR